MAGPRLNRLVAVAGDRARDERRTLLAKLLREHLARQRGHLQKVFLINAVVLGYGSS
jgi:hypothetical protein